MIGKNWTFTDEFEAGERGCLLPPYSGALSILFGFEVCRYEEQVRTNQAIFYPEHRPCRRAVCLMSRAVCLPGKDL